MADPQVDASARVYTDFAEYVTLAEVLALVVRARADLDTPSTAFAEFAGTWRDKSPAMIAMRERSWPELVPFLDFPLPVRRLIYTANGNRELELPVPASRAPSGALPDRAVSDEDPLPHRPGKDTEPLESHRQDQWLEEHPEHSCNHLRRPTQHQ